jgi:hypothetical protein
MVLSNVKPTVLPAGTLTVAVAGVFMLQVISGEVTSVTGELLVGRRTAAPEVVLPAIRVVQMSGVLRSAGLRRKIDELTMSRGAVCQRSEGDKTG